MFDVHFPFVSYKLHGVCQQQCSSVNFSSLAFFLHGASGHRELRTRIGAPWVQHFLAGDSEGQRWWHQWESWLKIFETGDRLKMVKIKRIQLGCLKLAIFTIRYPFLMVLHRFLLLASTFGGSQDQTGLRSAPEESTSFPRGDHHKSPLGSSCELFLVHEGACLTVESHLFWVPKDDWKKSQAKNCKLLGWNPCAKKVFADDNLPVERATFDPTSVCFPKTSGFAG